MSGKLKLSAILRSSPSPTVDHATPIERALPAAPFLDLHHDCVALRKRLRDATHPHAIANIDARCGQIYREEKQCETERLIAREVKRALRDGGPPLDVVRHRQKRNQASATATRRRNTERMKMLEEKARELQRTVQSCGLLVERQMEVFSNLIELLHSYRVPPQDVMKATEMLTRPLSAPFVLPVAVMPKTVWDAQILKNNVVKETTPSDSVDNQEKGKRKTISLEGDTLKRHCVATFPLETEGKVIFKKGEGKKK